MKRLKKTSMRSSWSRVIAVLAGCFVALPAAAGWAVVVFPKGGGPPVMGFLESKDSRRVVIREVLPDGSSRNRVFQRSEIDELLETVSADRLESLSPDAPQSYRDYAEELAEKRQDPEAREAAIRLYLIAAHLDPQELGRSSLLGMADLARNPAEQRKFRAMAFLLSADHHSDLLVGPSAAAAVGESVEDEAGNPLLRALRLLRQGKRSAAARFVERPEVREMLAPHATTVSYEELQEACRQPGSCLHCDHGVAVCDVCGGARRDPGDPRLARCPQCAGVGKVTCRECRGDYKRTGPSPAMLRKVLLLEVKLTSSATGGGELIGARGAASWRKNVLRHGEAPLPVLDLERLTEFDPRQCLFRDGQWLAP